MRILLLLLTSIFSSQLMAMGQSCETKYVDAYGLDQESSIKVCKLNDYGRKLVRKGKSISEATLLAETNTNIVIDKCEEDTELMGYAEELAIEICKLPYCQKMLVMEGYSAVEAAQECKDESIVVDSDDQTTQEEESVKEIEFTI